jgi:hypothetical protein
LFSILSVVDEHGDIVLSNRRFEPTNYADREFFQVHRSGGADLLYISRPVLGRVSGNWQVPMSRRISKPDGSFGGVVVLSVDPGYFARFYQKSDIGVLGLVTLVGFDGIARVRRVGGELSFDIDMTKSSLMRQRARNEHGEFLSPGGFDDTQRFVSYRTLPGYPLVVAVGVAENEVLGEFRRSRDRDYVMVLLISLIIAAFAAMLVVMLATGGIGSAISSSNSSSASSHVCVISARSVRRSSVRPKGSKKVPRRNLNFATRRNTVNTHSPYSFFISLPWASFFANSGGARWNLSWASPSNRDAIFF